MSVSVIIPVYNTSAYLPQCLDSVLSQDVNGLEVICINDGSTDDSLEILKRYAAQDSRIRIIDKANEGVGAARNDGIRAATSEYVAFMDSDDFYPEKTVLSRLYDAAQKHNVSVAGGHYTALHEDGTLEDSPWQYKDFPLAVSGLTEYRDFQFDYGYCAYIFRTALLRENDIFFPRYARFQDPPFFVKAMAAAGQFYALPDATYCYRILPSSNKTSITKTLDMLEGLKDNLRFSREENLSRLHFITACRLNEDASFMAIHNLDNPRCDELISTLIRVTSRVDLTWLTSEGFSMPKSCVPEVFSYMVKTAMKYEKLRNNKFLKILKKILPIKCF